MAAANPCWLRSDAAASNQTHQKQDKEQEEKDLRDSGCGGIHAREAQKGRDQSDYQKNYRVM
jgi:hypothetical protein